MSIPDLDGAPLLAVIQSDAGRLFVACAATHAPGFDLTAEVARAAVRICGELDGLPLAIALAAARVVDPTPSEIADRGTLDSADIRACARTFAARAGVRGGSWKLLGRAP
jgi:predicted ATPase